MAEITLKRSGQPPIFFRGELVAEATTADRAEDGHPRWYELAVYREERGAPHFWLQIAMVTRKAGEHNHLRAIPVTGPRGLAQAIRSHNALGFLKGFPLRGLAQPRADLLMQAMHRAYQETVERLYEALGPEWAETPETNLEPPRWHVRCGYKLLTQSGSWGDLASFLSDRRDLVAFQTAAEAEAACEAVNVCRRDLEVPCEPFSYD